MFATAAIPARASPLSYGTMPVDLCQAFIRQQFGPRVFSHVDDEIVPTTLPPQPFAISIALLSSALALVAAHLLQYRGAALLSTHASNLGSEQGNQISVPSVSGSRPLDGSLPSVYTKASFSFGRWITVC